MQPPYIQFNIITENVQKSSDRKELVLVTARDKKDCYLGIIQKENGKNSIQYYTTECINSVWTSCLLQWAYPVKFTTLLYITTYGAVGFLYSQ